MRRATLFSGAIATVDISPAKAGGQGVEVQVSVDVRQEVTLSGMTAQFRVSGHSDRGAIRKLNEDSFLAAFPVFAVADGMGGHAFGDKASQAAIAAFADSFGEADGAADPQAILDTISRANETVRTLSIVEDDEDEDDADEERTISGTTLSGIAFVDVGGECDYHWMAFNVGDSRTYSWNGRSLDQVSVDHSVVQELIDLGTISRSQAESHPKRNVVTRALGVTPIVEADVWLLPVRSRQTFLLCSDGLTRELSDDEIARIIVFHDSESLRESDNLPLSLAERLVKAAVAAGGSDNVTVVIVECEIVGSGTATPGEETIDRFGSEMFEDTRPRG